MDGIGVFPLFSTLMGYANGARFVGFIADEVRKGNNKSITHNIADYNYAIIFYYRGVNLWIHLFIFDGGSYAIKAKTWDQD